MPSAQFENKTLNKQRLLVRSAGRRARLQSRGCGERLGRAAAPEAGACRGDVGCGAGRGKAGARDGPRFTHAAERNPSKPLAPRMFRGRRSGAGRTLRGRHGVPGPVPAAASSFLTVRSGAEACAQDRGCGRRLPPSGVQLFVLPHRLPRTGLLNGPPETCSLSESLPLRSPVVAWPPASSFPPAREMSHALASSALRCL